MQRLEKVLCVCTDAEFNHRIEETFPEKIYYICHSYEEAVTLLAKGIVPDLIVVDLVLSGSSGPETLEQLQKQLSPRIIPGIITTTNDRLVLYSEARPPALLGIISKSGDETFLYERIKKLWDEYQNSIENSQDQ